MNRPINFTDYEADAIIVLSLWLRAFPSLTWISTLWFSSMRTLTLSNEGISGLFRSTDFQSVHADANSVVVEKTNSPKAIISRVLGYQFVLVQYLSATAMVSLRGEPLFAPSSVVTFWAWIRWATCNITTGLSNTSCAEYWGYSPTTYIDIGSSSGTLRESWNWLLKI